MKIRVKRDFRYGDDYLEKGNVYDLPDSASREAIEKNLTEKVEKPGEGTIWKEMQEELGRKPKKSASEWLTTDDVSEGDEIVIKGPGKMDDQFVQDENDKPDLVLPVELNGADYQWRLNKTRMRKFADAWGDNTGDWVGEKATVDEIVDYPNLGTKGFKVSPVTEEG